MPGDPIVLRGVPWHRVCSMPRLVSGHERAGVRDRPREEILVAKALTPTPFKEEGECVGVPEREDVADRGRGGPAGGVPRRIRPRGGEGPRGVRSGAADLHRREGGVVEGRDVRRYLPRGPHARPGALPGRHPGGRPEGGRRGEGGVPRVEPDPVSGTRKADAARGGPDVRTEVLPRRPDDVRER